MAKLLNLLVVITVLFSSCSTPRYVYNAAPSIVPYFETQGDAKLSALYTGGPARSSSSELPARSRGLALQGAYAISKHWALTSSYQYAAEKDVYSSPIINFYDSSIVRYQRRLIDFGGGYFHQMGNKSAGYGAIYFGVGKGNFSLNETGLGKDSIAYNRQLKVDLTKYFIQPTIYFLPGGHFTAAITMRFSFVHYGELKTDYKQEELEYFDFIGLRNHTFSFFEPGINMRYTIPGAEWVGVETTFNFCSNPYKQIRNIRSRGFTAGIGLTFQIPKSGNPKTRTRPVSNK